MKRLDGSSKINKIKGKGIGAATVLVSLIAFLIVISLLESNSRASTILDLQPSFNNYAPLSSIEGTTNHLQQGKESNVVPISSEEKHKPENISSETDGVINLPIRMTEDLGSNEKTTDNDEKPTLPTVSSEDTSPKEELVVKETNELAIPAEEKDDSNNSNQDDGGEMMLPTRLTEQWNQDKTTESSKVELNAGEKSETTEWSQDKATESSNTELNAEEKSEITESQSVNSENQEDIKPDDGGEMILPTRLTEQWNQDKTTESSKMELNAGEKSETTEWSQDEATESSNTELNAEEKSEITESQSANSENQEDIKLEEIPSNQNQKNKLECDFTHPRADTCTMEGDVRVLGTYSTVFLVSPTAQDTTESKIRPYARKWEKPTMQMIREVNVKQALPDQAPPCTVHHDVPVVVFSTGGFVGNVFHDYTDILIPLFLAANQYEGKVQFAVTDMSWWWIFKYLPIIKTLSPYPILNLDQDKNVHCFPSAQIGVKSHKPMGVDPTQSPNGYTMQDFRAFIRKSFSLKRSYTRVIDLKSGKRPRLLILLRRGTRAIVNEKQLIAMAKKIGFRVVAADPDKTREFPKFAHVVNSCDVMLGVHGAGLANMLYLPTNATVIQILPWGDLGFVGRHDYGLPLPDMGLRYVEHEIKEDESTLIYKYPRDHAVFTNPQAIHDQGWDTMYRIFLNEQNIMLNVDRFKGVLIDIFKSYVR